MTRSTRLGSPGNTLDEDESDRNLLQLRSPVLSNAEFGGMRAYMGDTAVEIDATFSRTSGDTALRDGIRQIQREAEDAVRGGCTHVILSDKRVSADCAP